LAVLLLSHLGSCQSAGRGAAGKGWRHNNSNQEVVMATMNIPTTDRRHIPERRTAASRTHGHARMSALDYIAMALLIIGGLNWASVALFGIDWVATIFGDGTPVARLVYIVVGLSALYAIYLTIRWGSKSHG
jgi:uncharacterized membrane protein YuzA (DUF378 family)